MKDTLIEIKNNLQGNNSRVDEAENQSNDLEHEEAKKQAIRTRRRKNPKNPEDTVKYLLRQLQAFQHSHHRGARRRREQETGNLFEKIMTENFPNLVKETDMRVQAAQSPKQDGCKQAHSKTHHKDNAKG